MKQTTIICKVPRPESQWEQFDADKWNEQEWEVQTLKGNPVIILRTNLKHDTYPVAAAYIDNDGKEILNSFTKNGQYNIHYKSSNDLQMRRRTSDVELPKDYWASIGRDGRIKGFYCSLEDAVCNDNAGRTALLHYKHEWA